MVKSPVVPGSWAARAIAACVCVLACCIAALALARPAAVALADEAASDGAGYVTVSGAEGIDPAAQFATLDEAAAALSGAPSLAEGAASASLVVHGTVGLDGSATLTAPGGAQGFSLSGEGSDASVLASAGGTAALSASSGSLVVRGVAFSGPVSLGAAANLSVEGCTFSSSLGVAASGAVSVCANTFSSAAGEAPALSVTLNASDATLAFSGNVISGFGAGLSVALADGVARPTVSVTGNTFSLGGASSVLPALCLAGGLWTPSSVTFDGNTVESATALIELESGFGVENPQAVGGADPSVARSLTLADGTIDAPGIAGIFELMDRGTGASAQGCEALLASPALTSANPGAAETVRQAAALLFPGDYPAAASADVAAAASAAPASDATAAVVDAAQTSTEAHAVAAASAAPAAAQAGSYAITYDANGASAGVAPESVSVAAGSKTAVAAAGSLVNAGFEFRGWNTAADGSGTFYAVGQVFVPSSDVVLYAQWTPTGTVANANVTTISMGA